MLGSISPAARHSLKAAASKAAKVLTSGRPCASRSSSLFSRQKVLKYSEGKPSEPPDLFDWRPAMAFWTDQASRTLSGSSKCRRCSGTERPSQRTASSRTASEPGSRAVPLLKRPPLPSQKAVATRFMPAWSVWGEPSFPRREVIGMELCCARASSKKLLWHVSSKRSPSIARFSRKRSLSSL